MNTGREIFAKLTEAKHLDAAVRKLKAEDLTEVAVYLGTLGGGTVAATVFGHVRERMDVLARPARAATAKPPHKRRKQSAKR